MIGRRLIFLLLLISSCTHGHHVQVVGQGVNVSAYQVDRMFAYGREAQEFDTFDMRISLDFSHLAVTDRTLDNGLAYTVQIGGATLERRRDQTADLILADGGKLPLLIDAASATRPSPNDPTRSQDALLAVAVTPMDVSFRIGTISFVLIPVLKRHGPHQSAAIELARFLLSGDHAPFTGAVQKAGPFSGQATLNAAGRRRLQAALQAGDNAP